MISSELADAILNKNSQEVFVLIKSDDRCMSIINPQGKMLDVPLGLFHPPTRILRAEWPKKFSEAQITSLLERLHDPSPRRSKTTSTRVRKSKPAAPTTNRMSNLACTWESSTLTFYRHYIATLGPMQRFRVVIEGLGVFEITRGEFEKVFNEVIISTDYSREGSFSYPDFPEKARRFLV